MKYRRPIGSRPIIWLQSRIPWSQNGVRFVRTDVDAGKSCDFIGHPSSSRRMGMSEAMDVEIRLPDHISGPPVGWRSARIRVAMFRAITDLHAGVFSRRV